MTDERHAREPEGGTVPPSSSWAATRRRDDTTRRHDTKGQATTMHDESQAGPDEDEHDVETIDVKQEEDMVVMAVRGEGVRIHVQFDVAEARKMAATLMWTAEKAEAYQDGR
jgi:hypothetical protein